MLHSLVNKRGAQKWASLLLFFLAPVIVLLITGCGPDDANADRLKVEERDELPFPLTDRTYKARNLELIKLDGKRFLLNNNFSIYDTVNELEVYSFDEQRLIRRIDLLSDTKDFSRIHDLIYLDHDSIFFTRPGARDPYKTHFLRMDSSGKVLEKWTFSGDLPEMNAQLMMGGGRIFSPLTYRQGTFYSSVYPERRELEGSVFAHPHTARITLKEDPNPRVELFGSYPSTYKKVDQEMLPEQSLQTIKPFGTFDHAFANGSIVFSYPFIDTLYRYTLDGKLLTKKQVKSEYVEPQKVWEHLKSNGRDGLKKAYPKGPKAYPHYFLLIHDPYRNLFYRTVNLGPEHASIMILDQKLRVLKETRLKKKPAPHMMPFLGRSMPAEEGLFIPRRGKDEFHFRSLKIEMRH
ncbi:MAG: DUF4221 family protein [Flavobacteriales bacterium]